MGAHICFGIGPLIIWLIWYIHIVQINRRCSLHRDRLVVYIMPMISLSTVLIFSQPGMIIPAALFVALGAFALPWQGLSPRDDVAERRNHGAGWAIGGGLLGLGLAFGTAAGKANPFVLAAFAGLLSMISFWILWCIAECLSGFSEAITVERDGGTALRLAAFLPLLGVSVGLAVSSWFSEESQQAIWQLAGVSGLVLACIFVEFWLARTRRPVSWPNGRDLLVALAYAGTSGLEILLFW
jgi:hypothetical protein